MTGSKETRKIRVLCVGGTMQSGADALASEPPGILFSSQAKNQAAVSQQEEEGADLLLLFLAGSGWDWLERLRLPDGIAGRKPLVAVVDRYNENFALALLKWGVEEVISKDDCTPAQLRYSILAAITRFQRNHSGASCSVRAEQQTYEQTALHTLDTLPFGIMFTDMESRVLFMNSAAKKTCTNGSGVYISKDKRCCAVNPDESSALHRLVHQMSQEAQNGGDEDYTFRITGEGGEVLTMLVVGVGKKSAGHGVAIFMDSGGGFFNISEDTLKSVYGLTRSEAGLLLRMVQGETLAEISEARSVTMHTVRAQLKAVFAKTDTNRQASLIKKVLTGPAVLMQR
jgi:DNA-binding NarL/FixJ family response regulator